MEGVGGSAWVGLDNFRYLFERQDSMQVIWNTLVIAVMKIVFNLLIPFVFAILLNEIRKRRFSGASRRWCICPTFCPGSFWAEF